MVEKLHRFWAVMVLLASISGGAAHAVGKTPHIILTADAEFQQQVSSRLLKSCQDCVPFWKRLAESGHLDTTAQSYMDNRQQYSAIQLAVEQSITELIRSHKLNSSVIVIHTSNIPTPLRVGDGEVPPGAIIAPSLNDERYVSSVHQRYLGIVDYLDSGGPLFTLHQRYKKPEKIAGYEVYDMLRNKYSNLRDHDMRDFPQEYSGATYIMRIDGGIYMFSVMAPQASSPEQAPWGMWYGQLDKASPNPEVVTRMLKIDSFLVSNDVDMYEAIGVR